MATGSGTLPLQRPKSIKSVRHSCGNLGMQQINLSRAVQPLSEGEIEATQKVFHSCFCGCCSNIPKHICFGQQSIGKILRCFNRLLDQTGKTATLHGAVRGIALQDLDVLTTKAKRNSADIEPHA